MELRRADLDDGVETTRVAGLIEAARQVDAPFLHPQSVRTVTANDRYGWDMVPNTAYVGLEAGRVVARGTMYLPGWDNPELAWLGVTVHPEHRGRGLGTAMLHHLEGEARSAGRSVLGSDAWDGTPGVDFVLGHGYDKKSQAVIRRQVLAELEPGIVDQLHAAAAEEAGDYDLLRITGPLPEEMLEDYCHMAASINDAPRDDLELEDDVYDPRRLRDLERSAALRGHTSYRVVARHRGTCELAGHSSVSVERWEPARGHQEDTTVVPAHRGHRLGLALKAEMLRWLAEAEPALETIETWNAESNDHMISINERLGYRILARELQFQKRVSP